MHKEVRTTRVSPTEIVCLSEKEITKASWTGNEWKWDQIGPSGCGLQFGQTEGSMTMALGIVSTACTGFLRSSSLWMHIFLSLDVGGRALDSHMAECLAFS